MNKDYKVTVSKSGKGVFSNVVKAINTQNGSEVAIKILRGEEIYLRSGERERQILLKLNETDKHDKMHIVRMLDQFEHRKHLCLVFESMDVNLREYLRSHGKGMPQKSLNSFRVRPQSRYRKVFRHTIVHLIGILEEEQNHPRRYQTR